MDWLYFWLLIINSNIYPFIHHSCKIVSPVVLYSGLRELLGKPIRGWWRSVPPLKHFDSHWVTLSRNSDACFSLDLPSPSRGTRVRRDGQRRLLSALSFSICMSHPAAAPGTICNTHTTPWSANTHTLHAQVVIRWHSLPLTRMEPSHFILGRTGIVYDFGSHKQTNGRNVLRRRANKLFKIL